MGVIIAAVTVLKKEVKGMRFKASVFHLIEGIPLFPSIHLSCSTAHGKYI
jgi:hypothetical protein